MPVKLSTTLKNVESLENPINPKSIFEFYGHLKSNNTSENEIKCSDPFHLLYHINEAAAAIGRRRNNAFHREKTRA